jgi:ParB/Sulfiredoxin domain
MGQSKIQFTEGKLKEVNQQLAELSKLILPDYMRLAYVHVDSIREQELNARSMSKAMFSQLIDNISNSGSLESVPLCAEIDKVVWIVSGHHRVRAARAAGQTYILVYIASGLTWDQVRAKQLAHNSIEGRDDPELVKKIFEQIQDVQSRFEAFIDAKLFDAAPRPVSFTQVDVDFKKTSRAVLLLFLPVQWADMETAIQNILPATDIDETLICGYEEWEPWAEVLKRVRQEMDVTAIPTAIAVMAKLASERLDQIAAEEAEEEEGKPETEENP